MLEGVAARYAAVGGTGLALIVLGRKPILRLVAKKFLVGGMKLSRAVGDRVTRTKAAIGSVGSSWNKVVDEAKDELGMNGAEPQDSGHEGEPLATDEPAAPAAG